MPERDRVTGGFGAIEYTIVRSPRRKRTYSLRVVGGEVEVRAPMRTPHETIRAFVEAKGQWVQDKLIEIRGRPAVPPFGHGDSAPYMGRDAAIRVEAGPVEAVEVRLYGEARAHSDTPPGAVALDGPCFHVTVPPGMGEAARVKGVREALVAWYRARAAAVFREAVTAWKPHVAPGARVEVRISGARSQWGSCAADGTLRFSWRCLMLEERQIEYIAVHELAHLRVRNHSKAFWRVVATAMPDAAEVRRSVTRAARGLPR